MDNTFDIGAQQAVPPYHIYASFNQAFQGVDIAFLNYAGPGLLLIDSIDLVDLTLVNGNQALLAVGASDNSIDKVTFFRGATYSTSQGYFPWRGSILLSGNMCVWIESFEAGWSVHMHGLVLPSYAGSVPSLG